jgi:hypothetical protein
MAQRESIFLTHPEIAAEWHPDKNDLGPSEAHERLKQEVLVAL